MHKQIECKPDIHLSIVSHGQCHLVKGLLQDLDALGSKERIQVTLTLNIPESEVFDAADFSFPIVVIDNVQPQGFGQNHNQAFLHPSNKEVRKYFFVINPDVRITQDVFSELVLQLDSASEVGVVAPIVVNNEGELEDSIRTLPTPWIILKKFFGYKEYHSIANRTSVFKPDWIAGMFMGFRSDMFQDIQGFDDKFFLYYEDVDICSRLWLDGFQVQVNPQLSIIHNAQRDSHRNFKYLKWHFGSMLRFFFSNVYKKVKKLHTNRIL